MPKSGLEYLWADRAEADGFLAEEIRRQQILVLVRQTPFVAAGSLVSVALVAIIYWQSANRGFLLFWGALVVAMVARSLQAWSRQRAKPEPRPVSRHAIQRSILWSVASGCLWGALGIVLFVPESLPHQLFLAFVLGGMASGSASAHSSLPPVCVGFVLPCVTPLIVRLALEGTTLPLASATLLSLYTASLLFFARNGYIGFLTSVRSGFDNRSLVGELADAGQLLEERVETRTAELAAANENLRNEIVERERAQHDLRTTQNQLAAALEAAPDGFALYDADDRLVLFNSKYREMYPESAEFIVLGASFEDIIRQGAERGQYPEAEGRIDAWVRRRVEKHRNPGHPIEQRQRDGRWLRIIEFKTRDGGVAGFRADITALKEDEARFRSIVEMAPVPLAFSAFPEGQVLYANPAYLAMLRLDAERMIGEPMATFLHDPDDYGRLLEALKSDGEVSDVELRLRSPNREPFWALMSARKISLDGISALASTVSDISERKEAEEALRESELRFRSVTESAHDAIVGADEKGRIVSWNRGAEKTFGYSAGEAVGQSMSMIIPERYREASARGLARRLEIGVDGTLGKSIETVALHRDGREFPVDLSLGMWSSAHGKFFSGILRDITERKAAKDVLRARAVLQEIAALLGHRALELDNVSKLMHETVTVVVEALAIHYCSIFELLPQNRTLILRASLGWRNDQADRSVDAADPKSMAGYVLATDAPLIVESLPAETRFEPSPYLLDHGIISCLNVVIPGAHGPYGVLGVYSPQPREFQDYDVHFLQHAANVLSTAIARDRSDQEKKHIVSQLQHAQKMEAIGTLAGGVAHDFNNILGAIIGYTSMARRKLPEDSRAREQLGEVLKAAARGKQMTGQILTFSRKTETAPGPVQVQGVVREALSLLRATIPATITIREDIDDASPHVFADVTQIHQVVMNLCTNAAHAMGDAVGTLEVGLRCAEVDEAHAAGGALPREGRYVVLSVSDSGYGMDAETQKRIFDPFYTTKPVGEGTGMGLSTVHGILAGYGGAITVDSEPGQGAIFKVYLPVAEDPQGAPAVGGGPPNTSDSAAAQDDTRPKNKARLKETVS